MKNTKIEYCTHTWNPMSGCQFGCRYCYAAGVARLFGGEQTPEMKDPENIHVLDEPIRGPNGKASAYPYGFDPTLFHHVQRVFAAVPRTT